MGGEREGSAVRVGEEDLSRVLEGVQRSDGTTTKVSLAVSLPLYRNPPLFG